MQQRLNCRTNLFPQLLIACGEDQVCLQPVHRIADVMPPRGQYDAMDRLALKQEIDRVGELDLAAFAGWRLIEAVEDRRRKDVPCCDGKAAWRLVTRWLLDE